MNLAPIATRLQQQVSALNAAAVAVNLEAAMAALGATPAAFVLPLSEIADPGRRINALAQRDRVRFGVLLAAASTGDPAGAAALATLESLQQACRGALLSWPPAPGLEPCEFRSGKVAAFANGIVWWLDEWETELYLFPN